MSASTETRSWHERHQAGYDEGWTAWRALGHEPYRFDPVPKPLVDLEPALRDVIRPIAERFLDAIDDDLGDEARGRILFDAARQTLEHLAFAMAGALGNERARAERVPCTLPPVGAWIRGRDLPRPLDEQAGQRAKDLTPTWHGAWHVFTGDVEPGWDSRTSEVTGRTVCGRTVQLQGFDLFGSGAPLYDYVAVDHEPGVDVCRQCARAMPG
jgi:hypothetical protein